MSSRTLAVVVALAATAGLVFAAFSTFDFVAHLDRQVHELHCSFIPGLVAAAEESHGCQVTLLSPYSSIWRTAMWGGFPISLAAMAVFAFLLYRTVEQWGRSPADRRAAANILVIAWLVPVVASAVMGYIALVELDAACKLCIGIYASSGIGFLVAFLHRNAVYDEQPSGGHAHAPGVIAVIALGQLALFVGFTVFVYWAAVPDYGRYVGKCGGLVSPDDPHGVMVPLAGVRGGPSAIEVFDPLCPACRAFEERLGASELHLSLDRHAVLFPLDAECNWMVERSLHAGACRVSEGVLCAAQSNAVSAPAVVDWAFERQESLTETAKTNPDAVTKMLGDQFPALGACLGSTDVKATLNQSLRWAVKNHLSVLTPQLYVGDVKLCDEDTDLGLEFMLSKMLELHRSGGLAALVPPPSEEPEGLVPGSAAQQPRAKPKRSGEPRDRERTTPKRPTPTPTPTPTAERPTEAARPIDKLPDVRDVPPPPPAELGADPGDEP